jgi:hypothetical protein
VVGGRRATTAVERRLGRGHDVLAACAERRGCGRPVLLRACSVLVPADDMVTAGHRRGGPRLVRGRRVAAFDEIDGTFLSTMLVDVADE